MWDRERNRERHGASDKINTVLSKDGAKPSSFAAAKEKAYCRSRLFLDTSWMSKGLSITV